MGTRDSDSKRTFTRIRDSTRQRARGQVAVDDPCIGICVRHLDVAVAVFLDVAWLTPRGRRRRVQRIIQSIILISLPCHYGRRQRKLAVPVIILLAGLHPSRIIIIFAAVAFRIESIESRFGSIFSRSHGVTRLLFLRAFCKPVFSLMMLLNSSLSVQGLLDLAHDPVPANLAVRQCAVAPTMSLGVITAWTSRGVSMGLEVALLEGHSFEVETAPDCMLSKV